VQDNGLGREDRLPASAERTPSPGKVLAKVHIGEGKLAEDASTNGAGDIVEAQHVEALCPTQSIEGARIPQGALVAYSIGLGVPQDGAPGQGIMAGIGQDPRRNARDLLILERL
jgi:hypothetical protein